VDVHASTECSGCEWERQPQAYRWFPELGAPLAASPSSDRSGDRDQAGTTRPAAQFTTFHQALT
jgi:hypothetical protein